MGKLHLVSLTAGTAGQTAYQGFVLDGTVSDGTLTVDRFVLIDRTSATAATVLQLPASRDADDVILTRATTA